MPIISTDIKYRLSGGTSNTSQAASIGGAISSTTEASSALFDDVSSGEAAAGDTEFRCVYIRNTHATLTALGVRLWVLANTPSPDTDVSIGLGSSGINGTEQTVADENTAPMNITFSSAATEGAALSIGDLPPGASRAIWIRRVVTAGAAVFSDGFTLRSKFDTLP